MTSILKNGYAIDNRGEKISFQNTMIIMATNITDKTIGYVEEKEQDMYRVEIMVEESCVFFVSFFSTGGVKAGA